MRSTDKRVLSVVAVAIANANDEIFIARRGDHETYAGQWEFPGGKIEAGETPIKALVREIKEELGLVIIERNLESLGKIIHSYAPYDVELEVFITRWSGQEIVLSDHSEAVWVSISQLREYDLAPADRPFIETIQAYLS